MKPFSPYLPPPTLDDLARRRRVLRRAISRISQRLTRARTRVLLVGMASALLGLTGYLCFSFALFTMPFVAIACAAAGVALASILDEFLSESVGTHLLMMAASLVIFSVVSLLLIMESGVNNHPSVASSPPAWLVGAALYVLFAFACLLIFLLVYIPFSLRFNSVRLKTDHLNVQIESLKTMRPGVHDDSISYFFTTCNNTHPVLTTYAKAILTQQRPPVFAEKHGWLNGSVWSKTAPGSKTSTTHGPQGMRDPPC